MFGAEAWIIQRQNIHSFTFYISRSLISVLFIFCSEFTELSFVGKNLHSIFMISLVICIYFLSSFLLPSFHSFQCFTCILYSFKNSVTILECVLGRFPDIRITYMGTTLSRILIESKILAQVRAFAFYRHPYKFREKNCFFI